MRKNYEKTRRKLGENQELSGENPRKLEEKKTAALDAAPPSWALALADSLSLSLSLSPL